VQISDRILKKKNNLVMNNEFMGPCGRLTADDSAVVSGSRFRVVHPSNRRIPRAEDVTKHDLMSGYSGTVQRRYSIPIASLGTVVRTRPETKKGG
jgi:hypothetical protein